MDGQFVVVVIKVEPKKRPPTDHHGSYGGFRYLIWRYCTLCPAVLGGGGFPYISRIHTAYITVRMNPPFGWYPHMLVNKELDGSCFYQASLPKVGPMTSHLSHEILVG